MRFRNGQRRHRASRIGKRLEGWSRLVTMWTGSSWAFAIAVLIILAWIISGPVFHF